MFHFLILSKFQNGSHSLTFMLQVKHAILRLHFIHVFLHKKTIVMSEPQFA